MALYLGLGLGLTTQGQTFDWVRQAGTHSSEQARAVSSDAAGNAYVTGEMSPGTTFEDTTLFGSFVDGFVAKYAPDGELIWVRAIVGPDTESPYDISTDADGNSYVTGLFNMTADFGDTSITSTGSFDMFLAKYDTEGQLVWVRRAGGNSGDAGEGVCVDGSGTVHVVGSFTASAAFGDTVLVSAGQTDVFLVRYTADGTMMYARRGGGPGADYATDVDARDDLVAMTGGFQQTADMGSGVLQSQGHYDAFVACFTLSGTPLWSACGGSALPIATEAGAGVSIGHDGHVYMVGSAGGTASFGPLSFTANGGGEYMDAFVTAYTMDGTPVWVVQGGGVAVDGVNASVALPAGGVAVTGHYNGQADFSGQPLAPFSQDADIFTAHYSTQGSLQWISPAGGPHGADAGTGICTAADGLFVAGLFNRSATFGTLTLPVLYLERNIFIAHLAVDISTELGAQPAGPAMPCLFPNPANDRTTLHLPPGPDGVVQVFDAMGRTVLSPQRVTTDRYLLDTQDLKDGLYLVRVAEAMPAMRLVVAH